MKRVTILSMLTRVKGILQPSIPIFYKLTLKLKKENEGAVQEEEDIKIEV